ncbi:MAG: hypothetical protein IT307_03320 [Chloroflexi bacterium]|nr:hypothetical protein [Chloroflexota bacterium]
MANAMASSRGSSPRTRERERLLLGLYWELGPERSLARLHELTVQLGSEVSLATLKRYSSSYDWQSRVVALGEEAGDVQRGRHIKEAIAVADRHAQIARALQSAGGGALQRLLSNPARLNDLSAAEIVRLLDLGVRTEARAVAYAADRREIALALANVLTHELVLVFSELNEDSDAERRARAFAARLDGLIDRFLKLQED